MLPILLDTLANNKLPLSFFDSAPCRLRLYFPDSFAATFLIRLAFYHSVFGVRTVSMRYVREVPDVAKTPVQYAQSRASRANSTTALPEKRLL